jgi:hypothetical protein
MSTVDCNTEMTKYHAEKVTLSKSDQDDMRSRRNAGRSRLEAGLKRDGHPVPAELGSQGEYMMRTMVQDAQSDYDIDDGAYFATDDLKDANGNTLSPYAARERVCNALKQDERLKHDAEIKNNCVRQRYPEGYHIDVAVYRIVKSKDTAGNDITEYEHASGNDWVKSDARAVTRWFNGLVGELNTGEADGSQMRRVTRLTKKFARSRAAWKAKTTTGICMTKLVVDHFVAKPGRDDDALRETWEAIKKTLDKSLRVDHPLPEGKRLAEEGDAEVAFLRDCLGDALATLLVLDDQDCTKKQALQAWDSVFNTTFFSDQPIDEDSSGSKKAGAPFVVTSGETARRDDGGRRFG